MSPSNFIILNTKLRINYLTAKVAGDDYSAVVPSEQSMSTAYLRDEHAPDAFAIDYYPRRETSTSNIVSCCAPSEHVLPAARSALLCTRTRCMQRALYECLDAALGTNYQLQSMNSTSSCILIESFLYFNIISLNLTYDAISTRRRILYQTSRFIFIRISRILHINHI